MEGLKKNIRDVHDFPKEGIIFKDIAPLLADANQLSRAVNFFKDRYSSKKIDMVVGIEARGFIFGSALAYALGTGYIMVRKPGKLPYKTFQKTYSLEYGTDTVEIHQDALSEGQRVIIIDDVLATGGTAGAVANLVSENFRAEIIELAFLIELNFLKGREKLPDVPVHSLIQY
ncbi:MAG: adenine phosphoribosyltransferase [Nitrospinales bacterium]